MLLKEETALGPCTIEPRGYQIDAIDAIRREFIAGKKRTLLVLPTGTGKTVTFGTVARRVVEKGGRALVLAHRGELIDQAADTLDRLGIPLAIEKADQHARALFDPPCVIATVQTMQKDRLATWDPDHFRMIIVDEAHHATAATYQRILDHFTGALVLGVTATADRADEDRLADVFDSVAYEMSLWDAMEAAPPGPYLCRLKVVQCDVDIDLRDIRTTGGDYNQADLEAVIGPLVEVLANAVRQEVGSRQTLVFTPDVGSAQAFAAALCGDRATGGMGLAAEWISGDDPDRDQKIKRFKCGDTQILSNCALLTEGFDAPNTAAVVLCRPTKSRPLYAQMVGRGTRLAPGKDDCLIIDFNYLTSKHDLVKPIELFDTTNTDDEVLAIAKEITSKEKGVDLIEAVARAEEEHQKRQILRVQAREREVRYRKVVYDPAAVADVLGLVTRGSNAPSDAHHPRATPKQVQILTKFRVEGAAAMSHRRAKKLIDALIERAQLNLATHKQVAWLLKNGVDPATARNMNFAEASAELDRLFGKSAG